MAPLRHGFRPGEQGLGAVEGSWHLSPVAPGGQRHLKPPPGRSWQVAPEAQGLVEQVSAEDPSSSCSWHLAPANPAGHWQVAVPSCC